ncbi:MAG: multicopper oxidase family protein [Candidatus Eremiobacterota bacterium]
MDRPITRRTLLAAGGGALAAMAGLASTGCNEAQTTALIGPANPVPFVPALPQPAVLRSSAGLLEVTLECRMATNQLGNLTITTPTYNGTIPGPTLRVKPGDLLRVHLVNNLPANTDPLPADINIIHHPGTTNLHTHGFHVSPRSPSDNIFLVIEPGQNSTYEFRIPADHPTGTYFYHPHNHSSVATQMWGGMGGCIIVEGELDQVPAVAAAQDVVMVFQEIRVNAQGVQPLFDFNTFFAQTTQHFPVNGLIQPTIRIRSGEVQRWRLLNSNVTAYINLQLDGHVFNVIAVDGNPVGAPIPRSPLLLANANRYDVLVVGGAPGTYQLRKLAFTGQIAPTPETVLATVVVDPPAGPAMALPTTIPVPAVLAPVTDAEITGRRQLTFDIQPPPPVPKFEMDMKQFDPNRVDQTVVLGAVEEWTITNNTVEDHPLHIHINPFQVVAVNGQPQVPALWQDTVNVPAHQSVTIRHRFRDFDGPYVQHCHILLHECMGMMQVIDVVPPGLTPREAARRRREHRRLMASLPTSRPILDEFCTDPSRAPRRVLHWGPPIDSGV